MYQAHGILFHLLTPVNAGELPPEVDQRGELVDAILLGVSVVKVARWQNLIPSFPWRVEGVGAPPRPPPWRNPRKERDQILQRSVAEP